MTLRAPFYEGVEGPLHFPEPKSVDNLFHSFSVASGWIILLPLCYLLYKPGDHLLFPAHHRGRGVVEIITLTDCAEFRKPPIRIRVTSDICKFLNLFQNHLMIPVYLFVMS